MRIVKYFLNNSLQVFLSRSVLFHPQNLLIYLENGQLYDPAVLPSGTPTAGTRLSGDCGEWGRTRFHILTKTKVSLLPAQTLLTVLSWHSNLQPGQHTNQQNCPLSCFILVHV